MNPIIIVEGETDKLIVERLLPKQILDTSTILVGKERSNAESLARSILTTKQRPIVLIYDADTTDEQAIYEQREFSAWYLNRGAVDIPFHTIIAVPTIEAIFFHNRNLLEKLLNRQFSDMEWELAQSQPQKALKNFTEDYIAFIAELLQKLDKHGIEILQSHPIIQELIDFMTEITVDVDA